MMKPQCLQDKLESYCTYTRIILSLKALSISQPFLVLFLSQPFHLILVLPQLSHNYLNPQQLSVTVTMDKGEGDRRGKR